jgi:hypothetical protein
VHSPPAKAIDGRIPSNAEQPRSNAVGIWARPLVRGKRRSKDISRKVFRLRCIAQLGETEPIDRIGVSAVDLLEGQDVRRWGRLDRGNHLRGFGSATS